MADKREKKMWRHWVHPYNNYIQVSLTNTTLTLKPWLSLLLLPVLHELPREREMKNKKVQWNQFNLVLFRYDLKLVMRFSNMQNYMLF